MGNSSGTTIGVLALIIALGGVGLGVYQMLSDSTGIIYVSSWEDPVILDSGYTILPTNITFDTKSGDLILFEFSSMIVLDISPILTYITVQFILDGDAVAGSAIYLHGESTGDPQNIYDSAVMRYYNSTLAAGTHNVTIRAFTDDPAITSYMQYNVLTVSIYK